MGKVEANSKPHSGCTELKPFLLGDERWVAAVCRCGAREMDEEERADDLAATRRASYRAVEHSTSFAPTQRTRRSKLLGGGQRRSRRGRGLGQAEALERTTVSE